ncbi:amidohydrolase family protein [Pseudomonas sp. Marseille-Q8238]
MMNACLKAGSLLLLAGSLLALPVYAADPQLVALKAGRLIDVERGKWIESPVVIIEGERIKAVGSRLDVPEGARVIDLGERVLLPGLIDAHVHIASGGVPNGSVARNALKGVANARKTLDAGFTTVRSMAGGAFAGIALRDAINDGDVVGPRLFDAGTLLAVTGGHCSGPRYAPEVKIESPGVADAPADFVRKVREQVKYGADFIKICITGGFVSGTDPTTTQFTEDEVRAVIETAHRYGKKVAVHAHATDGVKLAARLGADSIEHASLIDDEGIRLIKSNPKQVVVPTLSAYGSSLDRAKAVGASPSTLVQLETVLAVYQTNVRKIIKAGIPVIYGTDGPPGNNASEFPLLVEVGLTPLQALQAATIRSAEFLEAANDIGSVSAGKYADIIAFDGDPLSDLGQFRQVQWVMKGGVVHKDTASR